MINVGVLAFQGSVIEHVNLINKLPNVQAVEVKTVKELEKIDGIILPGGESTTIGKLLKDFSLFEPLKEKIGKGMPVWGTCAGLILLAKHITGESAHLGVMDITVRRNAFGRQIDSFSGLSTIPAVSKEPIPLVFVRAPWIEAAGENVDILLTLNNHIVAAQQDNLLVTSFHPELTDNTAFHAYFAAMCREFHKKLA